MKSRNRRKIEQIGLSVILAITWTVTTKSQDAPPAVLPIETEQPNAQAQRVFFQYGVNHGATLNSYAVAQVVPSSGTLFAGPSCTGTMVGPNVMVTAAHCHADLKQATFRAYFDATTQRTETFRCDYLFHTWPENDLALHWCFPNAAGENPGDKWGYVDFEVHYSLNQQFNHDRSRDFVREGSELYSLWWNPITTVGGNHTIYSEGKITDARDELWANPGGDPCEQNDDDPLGVRTDVWAAGGASGSLQFLKTTNRAILAPLSIASNAANGGPLRGASAIADMLAFSNIVDTRAEFPLQPPGCKERREPFINLRALNTLWQDGIRFDTLWHNFVKYLGTVDKNQNGVFDIQEDLERAAGESNRDFYYLGFDSPRLNVQAAIDGKSAVEWLGFLGFLVSDAIEGSSSLPAPQRIVSYPGPDLSRPEQLWVLVSSSSSDRSQEALRVCSGTCTNMPFGKNFNSTEVRALQGGGALTIFKLVRSKTSLWDVIVTKPDTVHDFDTGDKRRIWSAQAGGRPRMQPADIRPLGRTATSTVDWAGVVVDSRGSSSSEFSLLSRLVPIPQGIAKICFFVKRHSRQIGSSRGAFRVGSIAQSDIEFVPTETWQEVCSSRIRTGSNGVRLSFGTIGSVGYSYLVDDISIRVVGIATDQPQPEIPDDIIDPARTDANDNRTNRSTRLGTRSGTLTHRSIWMMRHPRAAPHNHYEYPELSLGI